MEIPVKLLVDTIAVAWLNILSNIKSIGQREEYYFLG